ncbi:MAG: site-2 protease family protein, partial [Longimicrobiales bacterium]
MRGFRLGSIFGIEIRIDYSWFVIFFLILWTLTAGVFPASLPGQSTAAYVLMGVSATLLFFASLLAHELSHSLVARSKKIPVQGITLFIFGGMARTSMELEKPGDEFAIAAIGPVSSILIAALFALVAWLGGQLGWSPAVSAVARYLALINVILAAFNLLPGFPLDGGRLFRAAVWKLTGDMTKATRWATAGGKGLGYALMLLGVLQTFAGDPGGGLWLLFIGWFVRLAAEASLAQYLIQHSLEGVRVADVMSHSPETVRPDLTLQEFVDRYVLSGRHHAYPVVEGERAHGIITVARVREVPREDWSHRTVGDVMTPIEPDMTVSTTEPVARVLERIASTGDGRVLVMRDDRLEGIITRSDIVRLIESPARGPVHRLHRRGTPSG